VKQRDLWSRFLAGEEIDASEEEALTQAAAGDPELLRELLDDSFFEGALRAFGRSRRASGAFVAVVDGKVAAIAAGLPPVGVKATWLGGSQDRRRGKKRYAIPLFLAGIAMAATALVWLHGQKRGPPEVDAPSSGRGAVSPEAVSDAMAADVASIGAGTVGAAGAGAATFESAESTVVEGSAVDVAVHLSAAAKERVRIGVSVIDGRASAGACPGDAADPNLVDGRDYALEGVPLVFEPGETRKLFSVVALADQIAELDETLELRIGPAGEPPAHGAIHRLTIRDADRKALVDVRRDFGARGDGVADDTRAVQSALDAAAAAGGGVVQFPPGVYPVTQVVVRPGLTLDGERATLRRLPAFGKSLMKALYAGPSDSRPLVIRGLTFDGDGLAYTRTGASSDNQHLLYLRGDPTQAGRLRVVVEGCRFRNWPRSGLEVSTNVSVTLARSEGEDLRGGLMGVAGGATSIRICDVSAGAGSNGWTTGLTIAPRVPGHGRSTRSAIKLNNIRIAKGRLFMVVSDGSEVVGEGIATDGPLHLKAENAKVHLVGARFVGGGAGAQNRILCPTDVTLERSELVVTRPADFRRPANWAGVSIEWSRSHCGGGPGRQSVRLKDVQFRALGGFDPLDDVYAWVTQVRGRAANGAVLTIEGGRVFPDFPDGVSVVGGGTTILRGLLTDAPLTLRRGNRRTEIGGAGARLSLEITP
jgi:hypothetical protein